MASRIELGGRYPHRTLTFDSALLSSSKLRPATAPPAAGFSFIRSWWREATRGDYRQELRSDLNEAESTGLSAMPPHASELHDRAQNQISLAASARAESVPSASMADPWTATRYPVQFAALSYGSRALTSAPIIPRPWMISTRCQTSSLGLSLKSSLIPAL